MRERVPCFIDAAVRRERYANTVLLAERNKCRCVWHVAVDKPSRDITMHRFVRKVHTDATREIQKAGAD